MGRELKRVALDFSWPLNQVWHGFVNPHYADHLECTHCTGSGYSPEAERLSDQWYGYAPFSPESRGSVPLEPRTPAVWAFAQRNVDQAPEFYGTGEAAVFREAARLAHLWNQQWSHHLNDDDVRALVEAGRLMDFTHSWTRETGWVKKEPAVVPTAAEVNIWSLRGMGHDSINRGTVIDAECERLGLPTRCAHCEGEGRVWASDAAQVASEQWVSEEPPAGEGYQIWETVSEGSPISPVFSTPEALATWMSQNNQGVDKGTEYAQWLAFIRGPGWAPSFIGSAAGLMTGVQAGVAGT